MNALVHAHSGLRWLALALLVAAIVNALSTNKSNYLKKDKLLNLFAMVMLHIQLLIGLILYFISPKVSFVEGWMKVAQARFYNLEHILLMVVAIALATIGRKRAEKQEDFAKRHKQIALFYTLVLVLIIAAIPWPFRNLGAG